jgi:predicted Zn finger-like uncharacterized protein
MILTCPSCRTRYQTDAARFPPGGRNVRCGKCGQVWFQPMSAPPPVSEIETPVAPPADPPDAGGPGEGANEPAGENSSSVARRPKEVPVSPRVRRVPLAQVVGWAVLLLMVGGIGWLAVQYRQFVVNVWPESASVYAVLGMPVNARGMTLTDISYKQDIEDGQPVLSVINISNYELPVPRLRAVLTDDSSREVYRWTFTAGVPTLKAGAESDFSTRLSSPPPEARNLNITFAESGG